MISELAKLLRLFPFELEPLRATPGTIGGERYILGYSVLLEYVEQEIADPDRHLFHLLLAESVVDDG